MKKKDLYKLVKESLKELELEQRRRRRRRRDPEDRPRVRPSDIEPVRDPIDPDLPVASSASTLGWGTVNIYHCDSDSSGGAGSSVPYAAAFNIGGDYCCKTASGANSPNLPNAYFNNSYQCHDFPTGMNACNSTNVGNLSAFNAWLQGNGAGWTIQSTVGSATSNTLFPSLNAAGEACCPAVLTGNGTSNGTCKGCMSVNDANYDAGYTISDPSDCAGTGAVSGCTTQSDCNYNPAATVHDQSECVGSPDTSALECTVCQGAFPSGQLVTGPNGLCGCTDPIANNYDPNAVQNDGSCIFTCWDITHISCNVYDSIGQQYTQTEQCMTYNGGQPNVGDTFRSGNAYSLPNQPGQTFYQSQEIIAVDPGTQGGVFNGDLCDTPNQCPGLCEFTPGGTGPKGIDPDMAQVADTPITPFTNTGEEEYNILDKSDLDMDTQTLKEIKNSKKLREAFKKEYTKQLVLSEQTNQECQQIQAIPNFMMCCENTAQWTAPMSSWTSECKAAAGQASTINSNYANCCSGDFTGTGDDNPCKDNPNEECYWCREEGYTGACQPVGSNLNYALANNFPLFTNINDCHAQTSCSPTDPAEPMVKCQCCIKGMPHSMVQSVPAVPGCEVLNNPANGIYNCTLHPVSGGPKINPCNIDGERGPIDDFPVGLSEDITAE